MRIVSLLPSATEILFAVGAGEDVVGVTFECDAPPEARTRTIVSTSALPQQVDGRPLTPAEIDAAVRERMAAGDDLYHLDRDALAGLEADLVVTQDLCAVCAVDVSEVHDALDYLGCNAAVLTTDPHTVEEVLASIEAIGEASGHLPQATDLVAGLRRRLAGMPGAGYLTPGADTDTNTDADVDAHSPTAARVVFLEWTDPPFAPGHWVPEMVTLAGGDCLLGTAGEKSVPTTWEAVAAARPEYVVVAPCGFHLQGSADLAREMVATGPFAQLLADLDDDAPQVWAVDANASFARPGPRLVDGIEALAAIWSTGAPDPAMAVRIR